MIRERTGQQGAFAASSLGQRHRRVEPAQNPVFFRHFVMQTGPSEVKKQLLQMTSTCLW
jgi:hypothetical protein